MLDDKSWEAFDAALKALSVDDGLAGKLARVVVDLSMRVLGQMPTKPEAYFFAAGFLLGRLAERGEVALSVRRSN